MTNEVHSTAYVARDDCESHWVYGDAVEIPARAEYTTLAEMLRIVRTDLGPEAVVELDQELITLLTCPVCKTRDEVLKPLPKVTFEAAHCPQCGTLREATMTHEITGKENFLHKTLFSVGVPPLHILRARNAAEYRFYELSGDLPAALHFRHFEGPEAETPPAARERIRIIDRGDSEHGSDNPASGRVVLHG